MQLSRRRQRLQRLPLLLLFLVPSLFPRIVVDAAGAAVVTVNLASGASALSSIPLDDHFISFTSDWWTEQEDWGIGSSILSMDLDSPKLRAAVTALVPAIWRIGGTRADEVWYQMENFTMTGPITSTPATSTTLSTVTTEEPPMTTTGNDSPGIINATQEPSLDDTTTVNTTQASFPPSIINATEEALPADDIRNVTTGGTLTPPSESTVNETTTQVSPSSPADVSVNATTTTVIPPTDTIINATRDDGISDPPPTNDASDNTNPITTIIPNDGEGTNVIPPTGESVLTTIIPPTEGGGTRRSLDGGLSTTARECHADTFCLTGDRWYKVLEFAHRTGVRIVFTLNYMTGTQTDVNDKGTRDAQEWDPTQARRLLEFTKLHAPPGVVFGFELGNEVTHRDRITNLERYGRAYKTLRDLVEEIWTDASVGDRPQLLGPAATSSSLAEIVPFVEDHVDIITYHKYQGNGLDGGLLSEAVRPSFYWPSEKYSEEVAAVGKATKVWIGEGAMASNSGQAGVTDTFLSTMWFANTLGSVAQTKPVPISTFCRQTLVGGNYGIMTQDTLDPLPDFYLMRLWTQIVGNQAVGPLGVKSASNVGNLLMHAFCGKNKAEIVLVLVNINSNLDFHLNIPWAPRETNTSCKGAPI